MYVGVGLQGYDWYEQCSSASSEYLHSLGIANILFGLKLMSNLNSYSWLSSELV